MLIIEIHVDTIEETNPSTQPKADEGSKRASKKSPTAGNRVWNAIISIPGSLIPQSKTKDE